MYRAEEKQSLTLKMPFHDQNMRALRCLGKRVKPKEKTFQAFALESPQKPGKFLAYRLQLKLL